LDNNENKKDKKKIIWLLALVLLVAVAATAIGVIDNLNDYLMGDEGAIGLVPEGTDGKGDGNGNGSGDDKGGNKDKVPGYDVSSDGKSWGTTTEIAVFRVYYENGERKVTVESSDGDKLIAPGTENSFVFKLKNTGKVPLDFDVDVDAYFTPKNLSAELEGRLSRYDGKWVVGDKDSYGRVVELDAAQDTSSLGVGRYAYYTLDWMWPFEGGNDALDTYIGTQAVEREITFTIRIKTTATISEDTDCRQGLLPKTGDNSNVVLWIAVAMAAFAMVVFLFYKREDDEEEASQRGE